MNLNIFPKRRACGPFEVCRAPAPTDGDHDWAVLTQIGEKTVCVAEFFAVVAHDERLDAEHHARLFVAIPALVSSCKAALYAVEGSSLDFLDTGHDLALGDELRAALALAGEA